MASSCTLSRRARSIATTWLSSGMSSPAPPTDGSQSATSRCSTQPASRSKTSGSRLPLWSARTNSTFRRSIFSGPAGKWEAIEASRACRRCRRWTSDANRSGGEGAAAVAARHASRSYYWRGSPLPVDPARTGPAVKLRRLSSSPRAHSALVGCGLWAGTRMQGQFSTSYAVWGVRRLGRLSHPQPLADLCDETRHVLSLRRRGLVGRRQSFDARKRPRPATRRQRSFASRLRGVTKSGCRSQRATSSSATSWRTEARPRRSSSA